MNRKSTNAEDPDILDEYDFTGGVRGKYAKRFPQGSSVIVLEPDLANVLPDSELVNQALRALAENITRIAAPTSSGKRSMIPVKIKIEVWARDRGRCAICGATEELHFDHILPSAKGGSDVSAENIQLLCARHNFSKD
jgi:5-methylcytosine-specific restriction endonuclease McrA